MAEAAVPYLLGASTLLSAKAVLDPPKMPKQRAAPSPDDPMKKRAAQRAAQRQYAESGRAGTILTDDSKLG